MTATGAPREAQDVHTRILRVTLAVEDCVSYWRAPAFEGSPAERAHAAFHGHWFGTKSESRVKTLLGDMSVRFDAYPRALLALRAWQPPRELAAWVCHFHTQLADPIYRRFSGEYLPARRAQGYANVDREAVARWVNEAWPERWSQATCLKFGGNLLAAAHEAGLLKERRDPRRLGMPHVPAVALEYLFYLLREVVIDKPVLHSPYVTALAATPDERAELVRKPSAVRVRALADVVEFTWTYPDLLSWANERREAA